MPPQPKRTCCLLGRCVCQGRGLQGLQFAKNLCAFLRQTFVPIRVRKKTPLSEAAQIRQTKLKSNKARLDSGHIVLQLRRVSPREDSGLQEAISDGWLGELMNGIMDPDHLQDEFWFHVGYVNYVSWQVSYLQLQPKDEAVSAAGLRKLHLPLGDDLARAIQISPGHFCDLLDFKAEWGCTVHRVVDNQDSLPLAP